MQMQKIAVKEQIVKTVVKSGNGGAVWVPKDWLGQEVVVILPDKPKLKTKEMIIHILEPYLKDIVSVFIYGSYARREETKGSDIDVMVITKDKTIEIDIKEQNLEIAVFELDKFKRAIQKYPVMYRQIVKEAEPLINFHVLDELKKIEIDNNNFKGYISDTKQHINSNKELIGLDEIDGGYVKSYSALYSAMLRLRGVFIIQCIVNKENFSNKSFRKWTIKSGVTAGEFKECYEAYRAVKNNENTKGLNIKISVAYKLLEVLTKEITLIEAKIYGK